MLVLGVRSGEYITIGQDIVIQVVKAGEVTRLAVQAPRSALWCGESWWSPAAGARLHP